jgi:hypothetical protein
MAFGDLATELKKIFQNSDGTTAASLTNPESVDIEIVEIAVCTEDAASFIVFLYDDNSGAAGDLIGVMIIESAGYRDAYRPSGLRLAATTGKIWAKMSATLGSGKKVSLLVKYQKLS